MPKASNYPNGFANGIVVRGMPLNVAHPGEVFWVNNSSVLAKGAVGGSNGNDGSYHRPFSTIDYAIGRCTANRGDIIMVMPGHAEAVTSTSIASDVAGVAFIGLGSGSLKPTLTFGATDSRINTTAANTTWRNFRFTAGVGDVVTAVLHATAAQNSAYIDIEFAQSSTFNFINGYTLGAAGISNDCLWERNYLSTTDTGQLSLCVTAAAHDRLKWYNNHVRHAAAVAGLYVAAATDMLGIIARNNFVQTAQSDGSGGVLIQTSGTASSGCVVDNDMKSADDAANVAVPIASKIYAARNYIAGADEVGTVVAVGTLFDNT